MLKRKSVTFFGLLFLLLYTSSSSAQKGPGGVGETDGTSSLALWLDASVGFTPASWSDQSGRGNNAAQATAGARPSSVPSDVNTYSSVHFDGSNDVLLVPDHASIDLTAWSIFVVTKADVNKNYNAVYTKGNDGDENYEFLSFSSGLFHHPIKFTDGSRTTPNSSASQYSTTNFDVFEYSFSTTGRNVYKNNTSIHSDTENRTPATNGNSLHIGNESGLSRFLDGRIAEMIIFNQRLNLAQRIITSNYLAAKYGRPLTANDFYTQDNSGNGNFDHDVAGIGRVNASNLHSDSQGTGIVRMRSPSSLDNDDYLFWGRNNKTTYSFATNTGNYKERISSNWRVSKTGAGVGVGTVTFEIDMSGIDLSGKQACSALQLIVDNDSNLLSPTTTYPLTNTTGNIYQATGVDFTNGDYFTVEYIDLIVLDGTQFYNGAGTSTANVPDITDDCYKLLVKSTATGSLTLTEDADVREVEVETGGKLVVSSGFRLQVENGLEINGDVRLIGNSQLIQNHTGASLNTGSGNLFKDQNSDLASVYRYNYWSSPVNNSGSYTVKGVMKNGTTATSVSSNPPDLAFTAGYDGSTGPLTLSSYWIYGYLNGTDGTTWSQKFESGSFNPGAGYILKSPGVAQNYTFKGIPNDGDISFSIDAGKTSLLGNPYPSALDANELFSDSPGLATLYFWEHQNELVGTGTEGHNVGGYIGGYGTRNSTTGTAANTAVSGTGGLGGGTYTAPGQFIPIGQGFFAEAGSATTVNFKNTQRSYTTEAGDSHFFKGETNNRKTSNYSVLKLGFEAKTDEGFYLHNQIAVGFIKGKTFATEISFDSKKIAINASDMYFQFGENGDKLVIATVEEISEDLEIPLTLKIDTSEAIFIVLDEKQFIDQDVYIRDAVTNKFYNLETPISLSLTKGATYSNRFFITFKNSTLHTEDNLLSKGFTIYNNRETKELFIKNSSNSNIEKITIYNLLGQKLIEVDDVLLLHKKEIVLKTNTLQNSIYIVRIETKEGQISKKFF